TTWSLKFAIQRLTSASTRRAASSKEEEGGEDWATMGHLANPRSRASLIMARLGGAPLLATEVKAALRRGQPEIEAQSSMAVHPGRAAAEHRRARAVGPCQAFERRSSAGEAEASGKAFEAVPAIAGVQAPAAKREGSGDRHRRARGGRPSQLRGQAAFERARPAEGFGPQRAEGPVRLRCRAQPSGLRIHADIAEHALDQAAWRGMHPGPGSGRVQ